MRSVGSDGEMSASSTKHASALQNDNLIRQLTNTKHELCWGDRRPHSNHLIRLIAGFDQPDLLLHNRRIVTGWLTMAIIGQRSDAIINIMHSETGVIICRKRWAAIMSKLDSNSHINNMRVVFFFHPTPTPLPPLHNGFLCSFSLLRSQLSKMVNRLS